jgi:hypothetical protein
MAEHIPLNAGTKPLHSAILVQLPSVRGADRIEELRCIQTLLGSSDVLICGSDVLMNCAPGLRLAVGV